MSFDGLTTDFVIDNWGNPAAEAFILEFVDSPVAFKPEEKEKKDRKKDRKEQKSPLKESREPKA